MLRIGLTNGTAYKFTVKATNINGAGASSNPSVSVTPDQVPGAPTIGKATAGPTKGTVIVKFNPPPSNGGSAITGYTVTSATDNSLKKTGKISPITVTGLTSGKSYIFKVRASNVIGDGLDSGDSSSVKPN